MNRRDFLFKSSTFATAGLMLRSSLLAQAPVAKTAPAPTPTEFKVLRRNVGIFSARGGTMGYLVNKDALLAIDSQFADTASLFLAGLPGRGGRKLDALINSHHHPDHTGGNKVLQAETKTIIAHANVPNLQRMRATADKSLDAQAFANETFTDTFRRDFGDETVRAKYHGTGHTSGDIVITLERANIVHLGDLMFNRIYPGVDRPAGASFRHWLVVLEDVTKSYPADAIYVFGHSNPKFPVTCNRGELLVFRDYISGLLDYVQKRINAGDPKEKIVTLENLPGFPDFHLPPGPANRMPANLGTAYDELTAKA